MARKIKPKKCFCGCSDIEVSTWHKENDKENWYTTVECKGCGRKRQRHGFNKSIEESVISQWNSKADKNNIALLECFHFSSDWTYNPVYKIDMDKYASFELQYYGDRWHVTGKKYNMISGDLESEQLSDHGAWSGQIHKFVAQVNAYGSKINKYSSHVYDNSKFLEELSKLYERVKKHEGDL